MRRVLTFPISGPASFHQIREARYAPGMLLPDKAITTRTEIRDLLFTVGWNDRRSWRWMKPYRVLLLGKERFLFILAIINVGPCT